MELSAEQIEAIDFAAKTPRVGGVRSIEGAAGTGKTTLARALYQKFRDEGLDVPFVTPSHKAAARARELGIPASTLHSKFLVPNWSPVHDALRAWIELGSGSEALQSDLVARTGKEISLSTIRGLKKSGSFRAGCEKLGIDPMRHLLDGWVERGQHYDAIVVDEAGMVSAAAFRQIAAQARSIILIGDPNQLYPVADNRQLAEDRAYGVSCLEALQPSQTHVLETIHRTAEGSDILRLARSIIHDGLDFDGVVRRARQIAANSHDVMIASSLPIDWMIAHGRPPVLSYTNEARTRTIARLRDVYGYPANEVALGEELLVNYVPRGYGGETTMRSFATSLGILEERNKRIARGCGESLDSGAIARALGLEWPAPQLEPLAKNSTVTVIGIPDRRTLVLRDVFGGEHRVPASVGEYEGPYIRHVPGGGVVAFRSAVAMTAHSAQGSEWPAVVVNLHDIAKARHFGRQGRLETWRRCIYTAVTRAQKKLVLII